MKSSIVVSRWMVFAGALVACAAAQADTQYQADRKYCMSSDAGEPRNLCLKEAAAAQAERQGGSMRHRAAGHGSSGASKNGAASPGAGASSPG